MEVPDDHDIRRHRRYIRKNRKVSKDKRKEMRCCNSVWRFDSDTLTSVNIEPFVPALILRSFGHIITNLRLKWSTSWEPLERSKTEGRRSGCTSLTCAHHTRISQGRRLLIKYATPRMMSCSLSRCRCWNLKEFELLENCSEFIPIKFIRIIFTSRCDLNNHWLIRAI